jgi:multidrug efflux pump subunit AcrA (membrane-fusion protein)
MKLFTNLKTKFLSLPLIVKIIIPLLIVGLGWFTISKINSSKNSAPVYKTAQVTKGDIVNTIASSGSITSGNNTSIYTSASGVVTAVYAKNGDTVKQGQKIAQINLDQDGQQKQTSAWASYLSAKNSVTSAQQNKLSLQNSLDTAKIAEATAQDVVNNIYDFPKSDLQINTINANLIIAQRALDLAQQKYNSADSSIAVSNAQLSSVWYSYQQSSNIIYAPASGILTNFALTKGMSVANLSTSSSSSSNSNATQSVGIISNPNNQVTASISLSEIDVVNVKPGQKVTLTLDAFPDKTFTGEVLAINTNGQSTSGVTSYPTIIVFDNSLGDMYPNMSVSANIIIDSKSDVLTIPTSAIQTDSSTGASTVKVMKNNQISQVTVETGISDSTNTEITSGLNEGDTIITSITTKATTTTKTSTTSVFSGGLGGAAGAGGAARRLGQ